MTLSPPSSPVCSSPNRKGFTQVELLVTIVIIVILASLYIPQIARTREAARSVQCKDNLHNLGIALHNYAVTYGTFPPGAVAAERPLRSEPGADGVSWVALLLVYLEQTPLSERINFSEPLDPDDERLLQTTPLSVLLCPSDQAGEERLLPASNYAGCHHSEEAPIDVDNNGAFPLNRGLGMTSFEDGLAQTLLIGEKEILPGDLGWWSGSRATLRNTGAALQPLSQSPPSVARLGPPSDPLVVGGFASAHRWGVHVALGDGSVRLLAFDVDLTLLQRLAHRADGELLPRSHSD
jgi:prepilin-type N-terminal cleavage/methylation domain-containing protein